MRAPFASLRHRIYPLTSRGRAEARLAKIAANLPPVFADLIFAPLRGRAPQIRLPHGGLPIPDPIPDASAHLRAALHLQAVLADHLSRNRLPRRTIRAWISVPSRLDDITYFHAADARGRHHVGRSNGGRGLYPKDRTDR